MALESLEAARTSSKEVLKKTAIATGNIIVSIDLLGKCFSAQYRDLRKHFWGRGSRVQDRKLGKYLQSSYRSYKMIPNFQKSQFPLL